jgi:drug/metabolite transporter (DMT)-like permease
LRLTNPIYFNLFTSVVGIPLIMLAIYWRGRATGKPLFSKPLLGATITHKRALLIVGLTYTINLTATFAAKILSPVASYVTAIKASQVLPVVIIGALFFHENVHPRQWMGVGLIIGGLACFIAA